MQSLPTSIAMRLIATTQELTSSAAASRSIASANINIRHCTLLKKRASKGAAPILNLHSRNALSIKPATRQARLGLAPALTGAVSVTTGCRSWYSTGASTVVKEPIIHHQFDTKTGSWQYVVADPSSHSAVIIDPVLDYDPATGTVSTSNADQLLSLVKEKGYRIDTILETHAHADHITAAAYLQKRLSEVQGIHKPFLGIGKRIVQVQKMFGERYGIPAAEYTGVFDKLFDDEEEFHVGSMNALAIHIPGHTPDHMGYKIGDNVFVGDSVFHIDLGSARADFPGGSAHALFASGRRLFQLSDHVKLWIGHDYPPEGRDAPVPSMTVHDHKEQNKHLKASISEKEFVKLRKERDATLAQPKLIHSSLQMNIRAGRLPARTKSGHRLLHFPMKLQDMDLW